MNERKNEKTLYFNKHINCTHNIVVVTLVVLCFDIAKIVGNSRDSPINQSDTRTEPCDLFGNIRWEFVTQTMN